MPFMPSEAALHWFRHHLLAWYDPDARPMPWKHERDPYLIWLSEVILQQTRVEQGMPYYERFRERFPDVGALAAASEDEVMKMWEGLGYYRRAQHMLEAARSIVQEQGGVFPDNYAKIRSLKGVGPYTAAAIASFAYDLPFAVVDGNVFRVLARVFGIEEPLGSTASRKQFEAVAAAALDRERPGRFNQAIMDFGATVCLPRNPACATCPLASGCLAFREGKQHALPVKPAKRARKVRHFHYLDLQYGDLRYIRKRAGEDIWRNLYEFPLIERADAAASLPVIRKSPEWARWTERTPHRYLGRSQTFSQTLSHQIIRATFHRLQLEEPLRPAAAGLREVPANELDRYAFPRLIDWYLRDNSLTLNL